MNYRQVEIFVTVFELGSVTEAADKLGLSQPAVSKSIGSFEKELGVQLFFRHPKGLQATEEGRALYLEAGRVTLSFSHLSDYARRLPSLHHSHLQVSSIPGLALKWLPDHVTDFIKTYPEASFSFVTAGSPETVQLVAQGAIDIGISQARAEEPTVDKMRLFDMRAVCVLPKDHPLGAKDIVRMSDLHGETIIMLRQSDELRKIFEVAMHSHGARFRTKIEAGLGAMVCRLSEAGIGIGIVDHITASLHDQQRANIRPLVPVMAVPIYLMRNIKKPQSLLQRKFAEHLLRTTLGERVATSGY